MAATAALIYLLNLSEDGTVHFVFPTEYLSQRDKKAFQHFWTLHQFEGRVEYHVGVDFQKTPKDLLIYDEIDAWMFDEPGKFNTFTGDNPCICLTATPGANGEEASLEEQVILNLGLQVIKDREDVDRLRVDKQVADVMRFISDTLPS